MSKKINLTEFVDVPNDLVQIVNLSQSIKIDFVQKNTTIGDLIFTTIDVKLSQWSKEDLLYSDDNIRRLLPRGLCFVFVIENNFNKWIYTLYGHPKFGDIVDRKCQFLSKGITINDVDNMTKVYRRKENGECVHWGAFKYLNETYEIIGSKNVHMILRNTFCNSDIELYQDQRYTFARKMARLVNTYDKSKILDYLCLTSNVLCGEGCFTDSQHFVKYGYDVIFFFAVTGQRTTNSDPITKISPLEIDNFVRSFNLPTVTETIVCQSGDLVEKNNIDTYFEKQENSEGAVVSCIDTMGNTMYMYKHKNHWYVAQRALREQMKKNASTKAILSRFSRLHIKLDNFDSIIDRFLKFNAWYRQGISVEQRKTFFENWVTMTEIFQTLTTDQQNEYLIMHNTYEKSLNTLYVVLMMAPPGSGKSFLARSLIKILKKNKINAFHTEQDDFVDFKNAKKKYQEIILQKANDSKLDVLILAKGNHTKNIRDETYTILSKCKRNIVIIHIVITKDNEINMSQDICVERIHKRGNAHNSLYSENATSVVNSFIQNWEPLTESEIEYSDGVIDLQLDQTKNKFITSACELLQTTSMCKEWFNIENEDVENIIYEIENEDLNKSIQITNKKNKKK